MDTAVCMFQDPQWMSQLQTMAKSEIQNWKTSSIDDTPNWVKNTQTLKLRNWSLAVTNWPDCVF